MSDGCVVQEGTKEIIEYQFFKIGQLLNVYLPTIIDDHDCKLESVIGETEERE